MADFFTDAYNFLQAPANARKANEAFKTQTTSTAPSYSQVQSFMRPPERLLPSNPYPLALNVGAATSGVGAQMGNQMLGPPMAPGVAGMAAGNGTPRPPGWASGAPSLAQSLMQSPMEDALIAAGYRPGIPMAQQAGNVPLPRPRPPFAPQTPVGANPGMGGALLGNGVMNPGIPPQQPPADGSSPLPVWAGDTPAAPGAPASGGYQVPGTPRPLSGAERYSLANLFGHQAAQSRQANATGTAGGYQYVNGQRVGYAPQTIGGTPYAPLNGASAYGLANAAGQIAALNRQAAATGNTGVYNYVNGVKTGTVNGQSSANAYAAANAGPGSVSAFERVASGRPAGSYSDGREPSGTGSLW